MARRLLSLVGRFGKIGKPRVHIATLAAGSIVGFAENRLNAAQQFVDRERLCERAPRAELSGRAKKCPGIRGSGHGDYPLTFSGTLLRTYSTRLERIFKMPVGWFGRPGSALVDSNPVFLVPVSRIEIHVGTGRLELRRAPTRIRTRHPMSGSAEAERFQPWTNRESNRPCCGTRI